MPRRVRKSGVMFKPRSRLFMAASDLTSARVAMAGSISDSFVSGNAPRDSTTSEEVKARITSLENELFEMEKAMAMEDKRKNEDMARAKEIQETSRFFKFVFYGITEDLDASELFEMHRELSRVKEEIKINDQLPSIGRDV